MERLLAMLAPVGWRPATLRGWGPRAHHRRCQAGASALAVLVGLLTAGEAAAARRDVATVAELLAALTAAQGGDEIVLADGVYAFSGAACAGSGSAAAPIVVRAATPLGARIELDGVEGFRVSGAHWHFSGLDVRGVCATDDACEHAFHVTGAADGFRLTGSRVRDFNAQLKVNAAEVGGAWRTPNDGLVADCEVGDTRGRATGNPVTKLNIDTGERWVVRDNYLHDAWKEGGNGISYLAFMKSGGRDGVFERNLAVCSAGTSGGVRLGLSFGGGGTAPAFCAPAFDATVPCAVEHEGGVLRNNVIVNCSDVGIYLNRARATRVLHNTLIATAGVDFRFDTTSGEADGNLLAGAIRGRDGATFTAGVNRVGVTAGEFSGWYVAPLAGDLTLAGDASALIGQVPTRADVVDDHCARARPGGARTLGALEHALGDCGVGGVGGSGGGAAGAAGAGGAGVAGSGGAGGAGSGGATSAGGSGGASTGSGGAGGASAGGASGAGAGAGGATSGAGTGGAAGVDAGPPPGGATEAAGCGCGTPRRARHGDVAALLGLVAAAVARRPARGGRSALRGAAT